MTASPKPPSKLRSEPLAADNFGGFVSGSRQVGVTPSVDDPEVPRPLRRQIAFVKAIRRTSASMVVLLPTSAAARDSEWPV
jgi:hypothetical protein